MMQELNYIRCGDYYIPDIEKICKTLGCGVDDILEFTDEEK